MDCAARIANPPYFSFRSQVSIAIRTVRFGRPFHDGPTQVAAKFEGVCAGGEWAIRKWLNGPTRDLVSGRRNMPPPVLVRWDAVLVNVRL